VPVDAAICAFARHYSMIAFLVDISCLSRSTKRSFRSTKRIENSPSLGFRLCYAPARKSPPPRFAVQSDGIFAIKEPEEVRVPAQRADSGAAGHSGSRPSVGPVDGLAPGFLRICWVALRPAN
jgi:hypothetical protein